MTERPAPRRFVFNATAYDERPSGARARALGLAAALLRAGDDVTLLAPRRVSLADLLREELGGRPPDGRFREIVTPLDSATPLRRALRSARWIEAHLPRAVDLFVTDYYPVLRRTRTALTVHDLRYLAAPENEPRARVAWFRAFYPRLARRATLVIVPSRAVGAEVERQLGVESARVRVVPNGLSRAWREAAPADAPATHLLAVGVAERRKDFATAVAALRRARERGAVLPLVVAGRPPRLRGMGDLIEQGLLRIEDSCSDARLVELARSAAALVHTSRYEGFALPVLEAMSVGLPVLAARCAATVETAAGHATLLPPGDVDAWAAAMLRVSDPSTRGPRPDPAARAAAQRVTWDAASEILREEAFARS